MFGRITGILLILFAFHSTQGQTFLGSTSTIQWNPPALHVDHQASFSIGYQNTCPNLESYSTSTTADTLKLSLFFDIRGVWPFVGCTRHSSIYLNPIDSGICKLLVYTHIIQYDTSGLGADTLFAADLQAFDLCTSTGIARNEVLQKIVVYPNPTNRTLHIEGINLEELQRVNLVGMDGKSWPFDISPEKKADLSHLPSGQYMLILHTSFGPWSAVILKP